MCSPNRRKSGNGWSREGAHSDACGSTSSRTGGARVLRYTEPRLFLAPNSRAWVRLVGCLADLAGHVSRLAGNAGQAICPLVSLAHSSASAFFSSSPFLVTDHRCTKVLNPAEEPPSYQDSIFSRAKPFPISCYPPLVCQDPFVRQDPFIRQEPFVNQDPSSLWRPDLSLFGRRTDTLQTLHGPEGQCNTICYANEWLRFSCYSCYHKTGMSAI